MIFSAVPFFPFLLSHCPGFISSFSLYLSHLLLVNLRFGSVLGVGTGAFRTYERGNAQRNPIDDDGEWVGTIVDFDALRQVATGSENTPKYVEYPVFIFVGRNSA